MGLWASHDEALQVLQNELLAESVALEEAFNLCGRIIAEFETHSGNDEFLEICGLTTLKGQNLAHGSYSLLLLGLAQEAGALLRPLIEAIELLTYFREEPRRVEEAIEDKLPRAGKIAKKIQGNYQGLRRGYAPF